jgi:hypothetical protein
MSALKSPGSADLLWRLPPTGEPNARNSSCYYVLFQAVIGFDTKPGRNLLTVRVTVFSGHNSIMDCYPAFHGPIFIVSGVMGAVYL